MLPSEASAAKNKKCPQPVHRRTKRAFRDMVSRSLALPVLGFAPELNLYRLCPTALRRNMLNDVLMTRFVAILSRFVRAPDRC